MNPNRLIKDVKEKLGIGTFIETKYTDYDLYDRILSSARMWFSRIYAYEIFIPSMKFDNSLRYNGRVYSYKIPEYITKELAYEKTGVIDVRHLRQAFSTVEDTGMMYLPTADTMYPPPADGVGSTYMGAMSATPYYYMQGLAPYIGMAQTQASYEMYRKPIKAKFRSPNIIEFDLRGMSPVETNWELRLKVGHPVSLFSVDEPHYLIFQNLAVFDIQEFLWNSELKGLDGLTNGYDNISLKIDDWANASERRAEYIEKLEADVVLMEGITTY